MKNKTLVIFAAVLIVGFLGATQNVNNVFAQTQDVKEQKTEPAAQSSNQDLLAIIEQLKKQIKELQDQLAKLTSEVAMVKEEIKITKELYKGVSGNEVKEVQKFLKQFSEIYPEGLVTGYYGPLTEKAVKKFQEKEGMPATGKIDETTRVKINEYLARDAEKKIIVCHYPPENPSNKHSLEISESALETHLAHGDTLGACQVQPATASPVPESAPTKPTAVPASSPTVSDLIKEVQQRISDLQQKEQTPERILEISSLQNKIVALESRKKKESVTSSITPISAGSVTQFITLGEYAYGVTIDGSVLCWSSGAKDEPTTKLPDFEIPVLCALKDIARIAPGRSHSCAVKTDGSAICWGSNQYGQLGNGTYSDDIEISPISVSGLGLATTADITVGGVHTCALKKDGSVVCWGNNGVGDYAGGQLGDGTNEPVRFVPTQVSGLGKGTTAAIFTNRAEGGGTCALKTNGAVVCWGENSVIGYSRHQTPIPAPDLTPGTIKYLSIYRKGFCALKTDNSVICSGRNIEGQLGGNVKIGNSIFTQVSGLTKGTTDVITSGTYYTCALKKDGSVICWGENDRGQLGDGTIFFKYAPVSVLGLGTGTTAAISASGDFSGITCALKTDGFVMCWPGSGKTAEGKSTRAPALVPLIRQ